MKKIASIFCFLVFVFTATGSNPVATSTPDDKSALAPGSKIEVYYFHFSRRCATCNAVESVTTDALKAYYPEKFKKGEITFTSLNLEDDKTKAMADKLKVEGQQLLFVSDGKIIDITDKAFMYALNTPAKLKAEVKKTVDKLLK